MPHRSLQHLLRHKSRNVDLSTATGRFNARHQHTHVYNCLYNNNNNNVNICIARLKQNSSGALMAQTNTVSVFVQMTAVTASGVADGGRLFQTIMFVCINAVCRAL